jgi:two-component system response regulator AtoC
MGERPLLVVDDDETTLKYISSLLGSLGYRALCATSAEAALDRLRAIPAPAAILLDLLLPGVSGLDALDRIKEAHPEVPVIVLSTVAQISTVVDAVRRGAADYVTKPFEPHELEAALQSVLARHEGGAEVAPVRARDAGFVSASPRIRRIKDVARRVADTDAPVLILGESGVGKEVVARFIHGQSRRRAQPFVKVNCAALPDDLLESELFGYEPGAFSGATRLKPGLFEVADGGSILLDEIGEMSVPLQAKLLHVLQDGEFTRLGGRRTIKVDARVMASTNVQLEEAVAAGRFREDLYFRLNVIRLEVPPLRERAEDIPMLCAHFVASYAARYRRPGGELPRDLQDAFQRHDWPGNVRELENAVRRYVILADVESSLADLHRPRAMSPAPAPPRPVEDPPARMEREAAPPESLSLRKVGARAAEDAERRLLAHVLAQTRWNRKEAASRLKISYKALLNKLKKWETTDPIRPWPDDVSLRAADQGAYRLRALAPGPRPEDKGHAGEVQRDEREDRDAGRQTRPWPRRVTR